MRRDLAYTVWLLLVAAVVLIGVVILASAAKAQDIHNHATGHDIYKEWKRPGNGMSCCSGRDCGPLPVEDVSPVKDGFYIHGVDVFVPMKHILPSPDGQAHLCCRRSSPDAPCESNPVTGVPIVYCLAVPMGY